MSTGLRLVRWAHRPAPSASERARRAADRRAAELSMLVRREEFEARREQDIARYLSYMRPFV